MQLECKFFSFSLFFLHIFGEGWITYSSNAFHILLGRAGYYSFKVCHMGGRWEDDGFHLLVFSWVL